MTPPEGSESRPEREYSEVKRQHARLVADLPSRVIGVTLTCLLFGFSLGPVLVGAIYLICIGAEALHYWLTEAYLARPGAARYRAMMIFSAVGMTAYCILPLMARYHDNQIVQFAGVMALTGSLLNVSMVRTSHLPTGLLNGLPPAAVLLWYPALGMTGAQPSEFALLTFAGVLVLIGYFISALIQNHRQEVQLAEALDRARAASLAKSRFLSAMSHEMRTPLNAILGLAQVLRSGAGQQQSRNLGREIEQSGRSLQALVEDVLDLAATTEGRIENRPVTAALRSELETAMRAASLIHAGSDQSFTVRCGRGVPEVARFDPMLLRKIVTGMTGLVCASSPDGAETTLQLDCECGDATTPSLHLRISCLQPAGGVSEAGTAGGPASNEGLTQTLVQRLVTAAGGKARIERPTGRPIEAVLDLPVQPVADLPDPGGQPGDMRALVVDDIATNRFVVVQILRTLGIRASEAESGPAALSKLAAERFDVVLLDMTMPGMDGETTFRTIRSAGTVWSRVPVIALTADALAERRDAYLALGIDGYVSKPVDRRILWSEIQGALASSAP